MWYIVQGQLRGYPRWKRVQCCSKTSDTECRHHQDASRWKQLAARPACAVKKTQEKESHEHVDGDGCAEERKERKTETEMGEKGLLGMGT